MCEITFWQGDITRLPDRVDAIVNAANQWLRGGGGVDGAIHRWAGPGLLDELMLHYPHGAATGTAVPTTAHGLNARWLLHAVGPQVHGQPTRRDAELLEATYVAACAGALRLGARTIALPAISTGIYGYPKGPAARTAVAVARRYAARFDRILFVPFDDETRREYQALLATLIRRNVPTLPNGVPMLQLVTRGTVVGYYTDEARATAAGRLVEQVRGRGTTAITIEELATLHEKLAAEGLTPDDPAAQPPPPAHAPARPESEPATLFDPTPAEVADADEETVDAVLED